MFKYDNSSQKNLMNAEEAAKVTNHVLEVRDKIRLKSLENLWLKKKYIFHENMINEMRISRALQFLTIIYRKK